MDIKSLNVGDLVAFRIEPIEGFTSPNTGRWGVLKLLHHGDQNVLTVSVLEGLHDSCPGPAALRFKKVLRPIRFADQPFPRSDEPLIFRVPLAKDLPLPEARVIGRETLMRPSEKAAVSRIEKGESGFSYAAFSHASISLDHEDRAAHDHALWRQEIAESNARMTARFQAEAHRRKTRLNGLTLARLRTEVPFAGWDERAQILPVAYVNAVRDKANGLMADLAALGEKPRRPAARALLRAFVDWLNAVDGKIGYEIETEEREDIVLFLEEVLWAIKQKPLLGEIDEWRDW